MIEEVVIIQKPWVEFWEDRSPRLWNFWDFLVARDEINNSTSGELAYFFDIPVEEAKEVIDRFQNDKLITGENLAHFIDHAIV